MTADYCFTSCVLEAIKRMPTIQRLTRSLKSVYRFCWQSLQEGGLGAQQVWGGVVWAVSLYCLQMAVVVPIFMLALQNAYLSNYTTWKLSEVDRILPSLYGQSREVGTFINFHIFTLHRRTLRTNPIYLKTKFKQTRFINFWNWRFYYSNH